MNVAVVDGTYQICRAVYSGGNEMADRLGNSTGPTFKFLRMLWNFKEIGWPIVVFDSDRSDFRKQNFPGYKEKKEPDDPEQIEIRERARECIAYTELLLWKMLRFMGVPAVKMDGQEGDDLIYHIAHYYKAHGDSVYCISDDADFGQLVKDDISIYRPMKDEYLNQNNFKEKYGFAPEYFILWKALIGDSSDCINGVKGIGEKTATKMMVEMDVKGLEPAPLALREYCLTQKAKTYKKVVDQFSILKRNIMLMDISQAPLTQNEVVNALEDSISNTSFDAVRLMNYFKTYNFKMLGNWLGYVQSCQGPYSKLHISRRP